MMRLRRGKSTDIRAWCGQMVERRGRLTSPWLLRVVILDLVLVLAVVGYGLLNKWGEVGSYGRGLRYVGIALIGFGLLTSIANSRATTDVEHLDVQAAMREGLNERARRDSGARFARFSALFLFVCAGLVLVAFGVILDALG